MPIRDKFKRRQSNLMAVQRYQDRKGKDEINLRRRELYAIKRNPRNSEYKHSKKQYYSKKALMKRREAQERYRSNPKHKARRNCEKREYMDEQREKNRLRHDSGIQRLAALDERRRGEREAKKGPSNTTREKGKGNLFTEISTPELLARRRKMWEELPPSDDEDYGRVCNHCGAKGFYGYDECFTCNELYSDSGDELD